MCLVVGDGRVVERRIGDGNPLDRLGEQFHASAVAGDGKVYFTSKEGVVRVVRAGQKFELLAENDMGEPVIASPAISDGEIFIRGEKHLFCFGTSAEP